MGKDNTIFYAIRNEDTGKYIAIDDTSGGYPYDTDLLRAKMFVSREAAYEYFKVFKNSRWTLHGVRALTMPVRWF